MGDAVRDGEVRAADVEDTIDAAAPRPEPGQAGMPVAVVAATRDYHELLAVERHHYAITREIARGGIGRVFEARDLRLGRQVAIKELLPRNRDAARRFEREARITARLQHPAIIHVYEAGVWPGGEPFYAMPLVPGRSLDKVVAEKTTLAARLALLPNVIAVADALAYAHNANVIHRDLKPANVLVGEFGETVVIDWGLAKDLGASSDPRESLQMRLRANAEETMSGSVVGTPAYMPPEQARGDAVDQRADVYALGALLYKVLSGQAPYTGESAHHVVDAVKAGPPVPVQEREPDAPPDLVAIVAKAMARDPDGRYVTASELAQDLKRFETGQLVGAHRYTAGELMRRWLRRHRVAVSIAAVAALVLIAFGVFTVSRIVDEKRSADAARANADSERDKARAGRATLLEERGRSELLDGHAGAALAYLVGAAEDGRLGGPRGFLIADAKRPFAAELAHIGVGPGDVVVAASPDGTLVATGGNGPIELRAADGTVERSLGRYGTTRTLAFDDRGTMLVAAGTDRIARVWRLARAPGGTLVATLVAALVGHKDTILAAAFSRDGRRLVTTGEDAAVLIWDLSTQQASPVTCHGGPVVSARMSPDGTKVLTASADWMACIIDLESTYPTNPRVVRQLKGHTDAVNDAVWSADGALVVTASSDGTARVWSAASGKPVVAPLRHEPGTIVQVARMSSDGLVVTAGNDLVVRVWELPPVLAVNGMVPPPVKMPRRLTGHTARIVTAALSADDQMLVTGGYDGLAKIWDLRLGHEIATFEHGDTVSAVAFVPGAMRLATGSRDGSARIWNTKLGENRHELDAAVTALAVAEDGTVAVGLADSVVKLLRRDGKEIELRGHLGSVLALALSTDGRFLISAGDDAAAIVWDVETGKQVRRLGAHDQPTTALAIARDLDGKGDQLAMLVGGTIELWSLESGMRIRELAVRGRTLEAIAFHPITRGLAAVGRDGTIAMWDAHGTPVPVAPVAAQRAAQYTAVAFSPSGDALVTAGIGLAHVWELTGNTVGRLEVELERSMGMGIVRALIVTRDGLLITGGDNGLAMIWDREKGKLLATRDRHDRAITSLALHGDELWIASEDHTLSAWNVRIENGSAGELREFMQRQHVPVALDEADVVRKVP